MSFSDDFTPPAAPFSGDSGVFDNTDVLLQSPMTNERVVDTQSGFLVVVRRVSERLALSFKRQVGTPPSSQVLLTPDESLKLSKILSTSTATLEPESSPGLDYDALNKRRFVVSSNASARRNKLDKARLWGMAAGGVVVALVIGVVAGYSLGSVTKGQTAPNSITLEDPLSSASVERFSRRYVADLLDFNPSTYRVSQVRAMASMKPELMKSYWKETNFPLSEAQLESMPKDTTLIISKIAQEHLAPDTAVADVYADLNQPNGKKGGAVHLKLKLGVNADGAVEVVEQKDLSK